MELTSRSGNKKCSQVKKTKKTANLSFVPHSSFFTWRVTIATVTKLAKTGNTPILPLTQKDFLNTIFTPVTNLYVTVHIKINLF